MIILLYMEQIVQLRTLLVNFESVQRLLMGLTGKNRISAVQSKMARAALDWSADDLATRSNLSRGTVTRLESGGRITRNNMDRIRGTLEQAGMEFAEDCGVFDRRKERGIAIAPPTEPEGDDDDSEKKGGPKPSS